MILSLADGTDKQMLLAICLEADHRDFLLEVIIFGTRKVLHILNHMVRLHHDYYTYNHQGSIEIEKATVIFFLLVVHTKLTHIQVRLFQHVQRFKVLLGDFSSFNFIYLPLLLQLFNHRRVHYLIQLHSLIFNQRAFPFLFTILHWYRSSNFFLFPKHLNSRKWLSQSKARGLNVLGNGFQVFTTVVLLSKITDNGDKVVIFFLHFLMVASALFCLTSANEGFHCLEDLIHASHMTIDEMFIVDLQEPMIFLVLLQEPMTPVHIFVIVQ